MAIKNDRGIWQIRKGEILERSSDRLPFHFLLCLLHSFLHPITPLPKLQYSSYNLHHSPTQPHLPNHYLHSFLPIPLPSNIARHPLVIPPSHESFPPTPNFLSINDSIVNHPRLFGRMLQILVRVGQAIISCCFGPVRVRYAHLRGVETDGRAVGDDVGWGECDAGAGYDEDVAGSCECGWGEGMGAVEGEEIGTFAHGFFGCGDGVWMICGWVAESRRPCRL